MREHVIVKFDKVQTCGKRLGNLQEGTMRRIGLERE